MSLKCNLNGNVCVYRLILFLGCVGSSVTNIEECGAINNPNLQSSEEWEIRKLCFSNQTLRTTGTSEYFTQNIPPCVSWTPGLMTTVFQSSFKSGAPRDHLQALKNITDRSFETCATTDYETKGFIGVKLSSQISIYAIRIATNLTPYMTILKFPVVKVVSEDGSSEMVCNVCFVIRKPEVLDIYCPNGTIGNQILIYDVRPERAHFVICKLQIYLPEGTRGNNVSTTTSTPDLNMKPESSQRMSMTAIVVTAAVCGVGLLFFIVVLIVCIILKRKKSCTPKIKYDAKSEHVEINEVYETDDGYQQVADYQPEYHIYQTVVYEEIGPRPDLLEFCGNIYSVPDDLASPSKLQTSPTRTDNPRNSFTRFKENEVYRNPDHLHVVEDNTSYDDGLKIEGEESVELHVGLDSFEDPNSSTKNDKSDNSITQFRDNEIYKHLDNQDMVKDYAFFGQGLRIADEKSVELGAEVENCEFQDPSAKMDESANSIVRFRGNEVNSNPYNQDMVEGNTFYDDSLKIESKKSVERDSEIQNFESEDTSTKMDESENSIPRLSENPVYANPDNQDMDKDNAIVVLAENQT